jgi:hypothetical protein
VQQRIPRAINVSNHEGCGVRMHTLGRKVPSVSSRTSFLQATSIQRPLLFHITGGRGSTAHSCTAPFFSAKNAISRCGVQYVSTFLGFARPPTLEQILRDRHTLLRAVIFLLLSNKTQIASCFFLVYNGTEPGRCPADLIEYL